MSVYEWFRVSVLMALIWFPASACQTDTWSTGRTEVSTMGSLSKVGTIVSTRWLRDKLATGTKNIASRHLRILDTTFDGDKTADTYNTTYLPDHIPQSLYFNIHQCVESTKELPRNLPDPACFNEYASSLGIFPDTHIIAYDRTAPKASYRTWWTFRLFGHRNISVLDGGYGKWLADGYEVTDIVPEVERSNFQLNMDSSLIRNFNEMVGNIETRHEQVVDARADNASSVTNPEDGGVIPGTRHVNYDHLFNEDGTLKSEQELRALFDAAGVNLSQPMVSTCMTGMTATAVAGAAHVLGYDVPVYYGSWTEWKNRAPIELIQRAVARGG